MRRYSDIRESIKTGDVLAWSEGGSWNSWRNIQLNLIKLVTQSRYNHVGIAYVVGGRVFVVEAVVPFIRIFPLSRLTPFYLLSTNFNINRDTEESLLAKVGLPYSKWEAIKSVFTKDTNGQEVWECAKLVNQTLKTFDAEFDNLHDTPGALVNYLVDHYDSTPIRVV